MQITRQRRNTVHERAAGFANERGRLKLTGWDDARPLSVVNGRRRRRLRHRSCCARGVTFVLLSRDYRRNFSPSRNRGIRASSRRPSPAQARWYRRNVRVPLRCKPGPLTAVAQSPCIHHNIIIIITITTLLLLLYTYLLLF